MTTPTAISAGLACRGWSSRVALRASALRRASSRTRAPLRRATIAPSVAECRIRQLCPIPSQHLAMLTEQNVQCPSRTVGPDWRAQPCARALPSRAAAAARCCAGGCNTVVLTPSGDVAAPAARPADHLDAADAADHRAGDGADALVRLALPRSERQRDATSPTGDHSTELELVIWAAPLLIIICLGALTWIGTHLLDPYPPARPHRAQRRPVPPSTKPLEVAGRRARLEVAVHLPRAGHRHGQRAGGAGRPADPLPHHRVVGDERLLRPGAGRHDLRDARHGDAAARGDQPAGRLRGLLRQLQRRRLLRHALQVPRPRPGRLRRAGSPRRAATASDARPRRTTSSSRSRARTCRRATLRATSTPTSSTRIVNRCVEDGRLCIDQMMAHRRAGRHRHRRHAQHRPGARTGRRAPRAAPFYVAELCTAAESVAQYGTGHRRPARPAAGDAPPRRDL